MPALLITSFGPWGTHKENASTRWWQKASVTAPPGWTLEHLELPVDWAEAPKRLFQKMDTRRDLRVVLLCGLAENRTVITPERFAHNLIGTHAPDIAGVVPQREMIAPHGPLAHASTLPGAALVKALLSHGIPAEESRDAGTYLCNFLSYRLFERLQSAPAIRGGFLHVPPRDRLTDAQWEEAAEIIVRTLTS